ncbi:hypothetical protein D3C79_457580 [compost metagenome]
MLGIGGDPHPPLRWGKVTAVACVHAEYAADGVGELHPVVLVASGPGTGAKAFGTGVERSGQVFQRGDSAGVSDDRHGIFF